MRKLLIPIIAVMLLAASLAGCAPNNNAPVGTPIMQTPNIFDDGGAADNVLPEGDLIIPGDNLLPGDVTPVPGTENQPGGAGGQGAGDQGGQVTPGGNLPTPTPAAS